jgi:hypothetical protein
MGFVTCVRCGATVDETSAICPQCGESPVSRDASATRALAGADQLERVGTCYYCGARLYSTGVQKIRTATPVGGCVFLRDGSSEGDAGIMNVEVLFCGECRRMELRVPAATLRDLPSVVEP